VVAAQGREKGVAMGSKPKQAQHTCRSCEHYRYRPLRMGGPFPLPPPKEMNERQYRCVSETLLAGQKVNWVTGSDSLACSAINRHGKCRAWTVRIRADSHIKHQEAVATGTERALRRSLWRKFTDWAACRPEADYISEAVREMRQAEG